MYRLFIGVMAYILVGVVMSGPAYAAFVSRHGLTPSEYQSEFDKQKENGFRLTYVSGYSVNEQDRYAAIWEQKEGPSYVTHHDMTSAQYQAKFNKWKFFLQEQRQVRCHLGKKGRPSLCSTPQHEFIQVSGRVQKVEKEGLSIGPR